MTPCACRPLHLGLPVDDRALNLPTEARIATLPRAKTEVDCLIVPGYTPRLWWRKTTLHPVADHTCAEAARDLLRGVAEYVIVSGAAVHGAANEAVLMRASLLSRGVPEDRIFVEPCARHTTTNLRNAARIMLAHRLRSAYVIVADAAYKSPLDWLRRLHRQAFYIGYPRLSSFHLRCLKNLGYTVGELAWKRPMHVHFIPSMACLSESRRETREGDP